MKTIWYLLLGWRHYEFRKEGHDWEVYNSYLKEKGVISHNYIGMICGCYYEFNLVENARSIGTCQTEEEAKRWFKIKYSLTVLFNL